MSIETKLQQILDQVTDGKKIAGTAFAIKRDHFRWSGSSGVFEKDTPFFIASTTKLFTTALILQYCSKGSLQLDAPIAQYCSDEVIHHLHVFKGRDYSRQICLRHLLAHTSGLPDYFQDRAPGDGSLEKKLKSGHDQRWGFQQVLDWSKGMQAKFVPGQDGKAHYSDTNYQLLGSILESVTGNSYEVLCKNMIIEPLGLKSTYVYNNEHDHTPMPLRFKTIQFDIPLAMTSFRADGGVVSTVDDLLIFIEAFFTGKLFPENLIQQLMQWNRIFFPMYAGIGLQMFRLPWLLNPTGAVPDFIGHSGLSGALAFYCPKHNTYIAGTVNQVAHPDISFKTMIKLTRVLHTD